MKLEASQGMLSGIGRRFSSLLFGSQAGASSNKVSCVYLCLL